MHPNIYQKFSFKIKIHIPTIFLKTNLFLVSIERSLKIHDKK